MTDYNCGSRFQAILHGLAASAMLFAALPAVFAGQSATNATNVTATAAKYPGWTEMPYIENNPKPLLTPEESKTGFMLFTRPITEIVYPNTRPLPDERVAELTAFATPGEFEPLTFAIYPVKPMHGVQVAISALKSGAGEIPASAFDVRLLRYYDIRYPSPVSVGTYRRVPELLEKAEQHSFPARECQRYWLTVKVPADTKAGLYRGAITITADGLAKPATVPVSLRVLGFKLLKDPKKHFTAYNYDPTMKDKSTLAGLLPEISTNETRLRALAEREYCTMTDYGFDMPPVVYMRYNGDGDYLYLTPTNALNNMKKSGLLNTSRMLVCMETATMNLAGKFITDEKFVADKRSVRKKLAESSDFMAPDAFFAKMTELVKKFEVQRKAEGLPEFIYNPTDEPHPFAWEFGSRLCKAVKDADVRTFLTKDPTAPDARHYQPFVDIWISCPYAIPYGDVLKDTQHVYWSYPNHNAGSANPRNTEFLCKGGRMTYGFGFWRSGYEGLAPWIWRWDLGKASPRDYMDLTSEGKPAGHRYSGCGNKFAPDGSFLPAVYWECFREGYDDERYIYTLQQTIAEHESNPDPECKKAVANAGNLLQEIWDTIDVQRYYLLAGIWPSEDFSIYRWRIAVATEQLLRFNKTADTVAPSVLVKDASGKKKEEGPTPYEKALRAGNLEVFDLGNEDFSIWNKVAAEDNIETVNDVKHGGNACLKWTVLVDHLHDGESGTSGSGRYLKGWPRIKAKFEKGKLDLTKYDYLSFWIMFDSNRDEVQFQATPVSLDIMSHATTTLLYNKLIITEERQRTWSRILLPIAELSDRRIDPDGNSANWKDVSRIQIYIGEQNYADKTKLVFYIDEIALIKYKIPVIESATIPSALLLPARFLAFDYNLLGGGSILPGQYAMNVALVDENKKTVLSASRDVAEGRHFALDAGKLTAGLYEFRLELAKDGTTVSSLSRPFNVLNGPAIDGKRSLKDMFRDSISRFF